MSVSDERLKDATSEALHLRLDIEAGGNRVLLKKELYKKFEDSMGRPLVDLLLAIESTFETERLTQTIMNISGGNFANFNLGQQVGTINATVSVIESQGQAGIDLGKALRSLIDGVTADTELTEAKKKEALEAIETIADQAKLPSEQRRPGAFRAAIAYLPTILSGTVSAIKIWESVHPYIDHFFK